MLRNIIAHALILIGSFSMSIFSQEAGQKYLLADTLLATEYNKSAEFFIETAQYDSAITHYLQAAEIYEKMAKKSNLKSAWRGYLTCLSHLGDVYRKKGAYQSGEKYLTQALSLGLKKLGSHNSIIANIYDNLGVIYLINFKYDKAEQYFKKSLNIFLNLSNRTHTEIASVYSHLGILYRRKGWLDKALEHQQRALEIDLSIYGEFSKKIANRYLNIGLIYSNKSDYHQALKCYHKSLAVRERVGTSGESGIAKGKTLMNIGLAYTYLKEFEKGIDFLYKALTKFNDYSQYNLQDVALVYHNLGFAYLSAEKYSESLSMFKASLSARYKIYGIDDHGTMGGTYMNMGIAYSRLKRHDQAHQTFSKALKIFGTNFSSHWMDFADTHRHIAYNYLRQQKFHNTILHIDSTINALLPDNRFLEPDKDNLTKALNRIIMRDALNDRGKFYHNWYKHDSSNISHLQDAFNSYRQACQLFRTIRSDYKTDGSKYLLVSHAKKASQNALITAFQLNKLTPDSLLKEEMFNISEDVKATILWDSYYHSKIKSFSGIADSLLERETQLSLDLTFYENQLLSEKQLGVNADSAEVVALEERCFDLKNDLESLIDLFEKNYPRYYNLKYQTETVSVRELQNVLDTETTLLEYFVGDTLIYVFTIDKYRYEVAEIPRKKGLDSSIVTLRTAIINQDYTRYTEVANRLYASLISPVAHLLTGKKMIIIPDDVLHKIPFDALLTELPDHSDKIKNYSTLSYLKDRFTISYAYSANLFIEMLKSPKETADYDFLAFAPVFSGGLPSDTRGATLIDTNYAMDSTRNYPNTELLATRNEVLGIQQSFRDNYNIWEWVSNWFVDRTRLYMDAEANETQAKSAELKEYRYIHFATHGFANSKVPENSGLVLMPDSAAKEDGVLHLNEVYNLELNADLVTLSACETGTGKIASGEGMISLARGFLASGARNLLVSQWQVNDHSTSELMVKFYEEMLAGKSKTEALRDAKNDLIQSYQDAYAAPYYWAPFILIGQ